MLRITKRRLHFWRFYWRRGGIGRFFVLKRWESFRCRYRHIKYGWTSPEFRRQRLFEMFHGCPMDFYFGEGPDVDCEWCDEYCGRESNAYEQWWKNEYMPGRFIYYYFVLHRRFWLPRINTEIAKRYDRWEKSMEGDCPVFGMMDYCLIEYQKRKWHLANPTSSFTSEGL